jgi:hypothetical protein
MLDGHHYLILNTQLAGSSPAISTNDNGSHRTPLEYGAVSQTSIACSARISIYCAPQVLSLNVSSNHYHRLRKPSECQAISKFPLSCSFVLISWMIEKSSKEAKTKISNLPQFSGMRLAFHQQHSKS